ncbi:MAG: nucleoside hydrolase [Oscillospiraceae bacterium]|nr:nucleoside hydrolase [Oscillospiraceae bacterium]
MRKILFDCDPGHDDVLAVLLALADRETEVLGIVTSAGNQTAQKTTDNMLKVLTYLDIQGVPVVRGVEKPLCRELEVAADTHGESGLDGVDFGPVGQRALAANPVEFMARTIREAEGPVTLVVTGPMTNTALLLSVYPELKGRIETISFMGGACFGGNRTPLAEYNIYVDPEAAAIVFSSGVPLVMCGLDVTLKAQIYAREIEEIGRLGNRAGRMAADLLAFFNRTTTPDFLHPDREEGAHLHDPCAVAVLTHPEKFLLKDLYGYVSTSDGDARGCTVIDYNGCSGRAPNLRVAFQIDRAWFVSHLKACIAEFI